GPSPTVPGLQAVPASCATRSPRTKGRHVHRPGATGARVAPSQLRASDAAEVVRALSTTRPDAGIVRKCPLASSREGRRLCLSCRVPWLVRRPRILDKVALPETEDGDGAGTGAMNWFGGAEPKHMAEIR